MMHLSGDDERQRAGSFRGCLFMCLWTIAALLLGLSLLVLLSVFFAVFVLQHTEAPARPVSVVSSFERGDIIRSCRYPQVNTCKYTESISTIKFKVLVWILYKQNIIFRVFWIFLFPCEVYLFTFVSLMPFFRSWNGATSLLRLERIKLLSTKDLACLLMRHTSVPSPRQTLALWTLYLDIRILVLLGILELILTRIRYALDQSRFPFEYSSICQR